MKLKDFVTLGNLLGGFASVIALFQGSFDWACYFVYIAYVFDVLDGPVARLTKQYDAFGGILDTVCDYITNSITTSFIIYYAFWKMAGYHWLVAAVIAAFPFTFGTIRQAKGMEKELSYPCYWLGVPRPVLALFVLAVLNSSLFNLGISPWQEIGQVVAALLVIVLSILHLSSIPFINHQKRRWMGANRFGAWFFLAGTPLSWLVGWLVFGWPRMAYDHLLISFFVYVFFSWTQIPKTDLRRIRAYVAGGPLVKPLVHRDNDWRSASLADYFLAEDVPDPPEEPV
ncbi:MAG: CDP-alcohol phosphatidyltransferase family protein [Deltaproteobacteria bacterium]|nr:CDP-alcohol phosphatidyltransferase family protein [Deltaproteobacteria bacterium]